MDINFDRIKDLGATPPSVVIDKIVIQDGKAMELQIGPFQPIRLDHDKTNNDAMTLWYTRHAGDEKVEIVNVRIRLFLDGHTVTPQVHHYVGSFWDEGLLWHTFLDRTEQFNDERREIGLAIRKALDEIGGVVDQVAGDIQDGVDHDEFIRRLLSYTDEESEENA